MSNFTFISYRHQEPDSTLAQTFANAIKDSGNEVFIDTGIAWGKNWAEEIRKGLERSDFFLLLLSRESADSEMVREEISIARELQANTGKPILLPIRVQLPFSEALPYHISAHLREIQQKQWNDEGNTAPLVSQLMSLITGTTTQWEGKKEDPKNISLPQKSVKPLPSFDPRTLVNPGGALDIDSTCYIPRVSDQQVAESIYTNRFLATIKGPRQTGKTSLIVRSYAQFLNESEHHHSAFIDFQVLEKEAYANAKTLWKAVVEQMADQLDIWDWEEDWKEERPFNSNVNRFLKRHVLKDPAAQLLLCMDEVDTVFGYPVYEEFFPSIRAFYNKGAFDKIWKRVKWMLGTSSDPSLFIPDFKQSPFNVGIPIQLQPFSQHQVVEFGEKLNNQISSELSEKTIDYLGGSPFLVHLMLYHLIKHPEREATYFDGTTAGGGIFRDHVHRFLVFFQKDEGMANTMYAITQGKGCSDVGVADRLAGAGLVKRDATGKVVPFCRLYQEYFEKELG